MTKSDAIHETGEFYGTMPEDPPAKLPAGSQSMGQHGEPMDMSGWVLNRDSEYYWNASRVVYQDPANQLRWNPVSFVNWTTVRKSAPSPLPEFRAKVGDWVEWNTIGERRVGRFIAGNGEALRTVEPIDGGNNATLHYTHLRPWTPRVGEMCEGTVAPGVNAAGETFRGKLHRYDVTHGNREAVLHSDDGAAWVIPDSLRPAPHPVESIPDALACPSCGVKAGSPASQKQCGDSWHRGKAPSGGASGQSKADPYAAVRALNPADVALHMATRDAAYRSKVAALTLDIDRPSVTHDKMGRPIARWTGWCSTVHERRM